jgi:hypothetical protein
MVICSVIIRFNPGDRGCVPLIYWLSDTRLHRKHHPEASNISCKNVKGKNNVMKRTGNRINNIFLHCNETTARADLNQAQK